MKLSRITIPFICHLQWMNEQVAQIWHCHGNNKFIHYRLPYIVQESLKTWVEILQTQLYSTSSAKSLHRKWPIRSSNLHLNSSFWKILAGLCAPRTSLSRLPPGQKWLIHQNLFSTPAIAITLIYFLKLVLLQIKLWSTCSLMREVRYEGEKKTKTNKHQIFRFCFNANAEFSKTGSHLTTYFCSV